MPAMASAAVVADAARNAVAKQNPVYRAILREGVVYCRYLPATPPELQGQLRQVATLLSAGIIYKGEEGFGPEGLLGKFQGLDTMVLGTAEHWAQLRQAQRFLSGEQPLPVDWYEAPTDADRRHFGGTLYIGSPEFAGCCEQVAASLGIPFEVYQGESGQWECRAGPGDLDALFDEALVLFITSKPEEQPDGI